MSDYVCIGEDRFWPDWFHERVADNTIVTKSGGWRQPIVAADVLIRGQYVRAHRGDRVVLQDDGALTITYGGNVA